MLLDITSKASPEETNKFASLPTSSVPVLLEMPKIFAGFEVINSNASSLVIP